MGSVSHGGAGISPALIRAGLLVAGLNALLLGFSPATASTFVAVKFALALVLAPLALLATLWGAAARGSDYDGGASVVVSSTDVVLGGASAFALLSLAFAENPLVSLSGQYNVWTGLYLFVLGVCLYVLGRTIRGDESLRVVVWGLAVALALVAIIGLLQAAQWEPLRFRVGFGIGGRPGSTLGNPVYFGGAMAVLVAICAAALWSPRRWEQIAGLVLGTLGLVALVDSLTRAGWLGAIVGVICVWGAAIWVTRGEGGLGVRLVRRVLPPALVVVAVVVVMAAVVPAATGGGWSLVERATISADPTAPGGTPRLEIWKVAARAIADRPVVGWGPGGYTYASQQHMTLERQRLEPGLEDADAHSLPIELAATYGVPFAVLLVLAFLLTWWSGARAFVRRRPGASGEAPASVAEESSDALDSWPLLALWGAFSALGVYALASPQLLSLTALTFSLAGIVQRAGVASAPRGGWKGLFSGRSVREARLPSGSGDWLPAAVLSVLLVWTGLAGYWGQRVLRADVAYLRGVTGSSLDQLKKAVALDPIESQYVEGLANLELDRGSRLGDPGMQEASILHYRRALSIDRGSVDGRNSLVAALMTTGQWEEAAVESRASLARAPLDARAHLDLAVALAMTGRAEEGRAHLDRGLEILPGDPYTWYLAGRYWAGAGNQAKAREAWEHSLEIDPTFALSASALERAEDAASGSVE